MSPENQPTLDTNECARELFAAAQIQAATHGRQLGQGAHDEIHRFATKAAPHIVRDPTKLDEARAAFARLVDEMVVASDEIDGYRVDHDVIIGERTLSLALSRLCPLFPIC